VASVSSFNDWQKEKQFLKLQAESDKDNVVSKMFSSIRVLACNPPSGYYLFP
jgi:hypothetical protein